MLLVDACSSPLLPSRSPPWWNPLPEKDLKQVWPHHKRCEQPSLIPSICSLLFPSQMCVRVNNIHALISIFPSLESHIYSTTFSPAQRFPFAATNECGLSSTTATESASLLQSLEAHTQRPNPHRYRSEQRNSSSIQLLPARGGSDKVSSDASVYASPAQRRKSETGFQSGESRQLMEYLNKTLEYQLEMLSIRVSLSISVSRSLNNLLSSFL